MKRREAVGGRNNHQIYVRLTASGEKRFEVYYKDGVGQHFDCTDENGNYFQTLGAAQAYRDRKLGRKASGERVVSDARLTFKDAREAWWKGYVAGLKPKTQESYGCSIRHLSTEFDNFRLVDITPTEAAAYIAEKKKTLKGWTIRSHQVALSSIFNYATRHLGYKGANPVAALEHKEKASVQDSKQQRSLNKHELDALLNSIEEPYRLLFTVAARTGARLGETLALVYKDVDLKAGTILITHQLQKVDGKLKRVELKTKRSKRRLKLTPEIIAALREHKAASEYSQEYDYVFCTREGRPYDHRNIGGRVMGRAVAKAGLSAIERDGEIIIPAPTFHTLRHTHGSQMIDAGFSIAQVSARLGHADPSITLRVYVHELQDPQQDERYEQGLVAMETMETAAQSSAGHQASPQTAEIIPMQGISSS